MKRDQFPKIDLAQMDIRTVYPGASPEDVELNVTNKIEDALREVTGIDRDDIRGKDQLEIDIDYSKLARLGLTVAEVARNVRLAYDGELVTSMRDGAEDLRFRVQLVRKARRDERFLLNLPIPNQQGRLIRLGEAAALRTGPGPNAYRHYQGERATTITADVDTDVTTPLKATTEVLSRINPEKDWPGTEIIVGGEAGESRKSIVRLAITFIIALLGIYFLLVLVPSLYLIGSDMGRIFKRKRAQAGDL